MAQKNKLRRFQELDTFPNVYQAEQGNHTVLYGYQGKIHLKGRWSKKHFGNSNPVTLELACGKGEYTTGLASRYPQRNFIGVDIKGARLWKGAKCALDQKIGNAAFLRIRIEHIANFFDPNEVDEIWITFPDPFPKKENRRLTSPNFVKEYRKISKNAAIVHLKTDDESLYEYTRAVILADKSLHLLACIKNVNKDNSLDSDFELKTYYEKMHIKMNKKIKYVSFSI